MTAPKTEKLYLTDPCTVAFRARIVACDRSHEGQTAVVLDRTCFYPESGGQTADTGSLGDFRVVDVQESDDDAILHFLEPDSDFPDSLIGAETDCLVDWDRRFDHMHQHSGQHVLSRAFIEVGGLATVSFHMGEDKSTIDLEGAGFDENVTRRAEELANATVFANLPVSVRVLPVDEVEAVEGLELRRSIPDGVTEARLVEVERFDVIPCCGTHVSSTSQLGLIKVLKSEKARGLNRVSFKVGGRALQDYADKHEIVHSLGIRLTTSSADISAKVDKLISQAQQARKDLKKISAALAEYEARSLVREAGGQGASVIVRYFADRDDAYLRLISTALKREPATVVILGAATGGIVCSASEGVVVDFTRTAVEPVRAAGGSGGGKGAYVQLKLPEGADVEKYLEEIAENVRNVLQ